MKQKSQEKQFVRQTSAFRNLIENDSKATFPAAKNRYHLYVSYACPWAHRTIIMRSLKGLEGIISLSPVDTILNMQGWSFGQEGKATIDPINHVNYLLDVYVASDPAYTDNATVPVLYDKQLQTIVNNESAEIIRLLNSAFATYSTNAEDYYPLHLQTEINAINQFVYDNINNGVYKAGLAPTKEAYEQALKKLFSALDQLENDLADKKYLVGQQLTEADIRLLTTLVRFDPVYYDLFHCNIRKIADYPNLSAYLERLCAIPEIANTIQMDVIKHHYYESPKLLSKIRYPF
jgi:putative glutathione S-transferase